MFDNLRDHLTEHFVIMVAVAAIVFSLLMAFKPAVIQSVEIHDMGNGVTCYTFVSSIDCLKIDNSR